MKILFAASEAFPLVKTGGLADVAGALPAALAAAGSDVRLMLPAYPEVLARARSIEPAATLGPLLGDAPVRLLTARMPDSDLELLLVDSPPLYERAGGPYTDAHGVDWPDNHLRFGVLSLAAAKVAAGTRDVGWRPDILHANDWQTGLAPAYLRFSGAPNTRSVVTIHNMRFQGLFPATALPELQLPALSFTMEGLEFHGQLSMLKAGLAFADRITTVSPTYAEEIQTAEFGYGMEGLLAARRRDLSGVLNGVDYRQWSPATDESLAQRYTAADIAGKATCKSALQHELGLDADPARPLAAMVGRLTEQKGIDLVVSTLPQMMALGVQIAILGSGEAHWEQALTEAAHAHVGVATRIGYDEQLAHRIIAGADLFLMPSRFEPCGLTQMYAMRYGTLPVVRRTGGLADTVREAAGPGGTGTGFLFDAAEPEAFLGALQRGVTMYADKPAWRLAQRAAMQQDFSWDRAADEYLWIYRALAPHLAAGTAWGRMRGA